MRCLLVAVSTTSFNRGEIKLLVIGSKRGTVVHHFQTRSPDQLCPLLKLFPTHYCRSATWKNLLISNRNRVQRNHPVVSYTAMTKHYCLRTCTLEPRSTFPPPRAWKL